MKRYSLGGLTLAMASASLPFLAAAANYSYVEGGYLYRDAYDRNGSGVRLEGSVNLLPPLAAFASFSNDNDMNQFGFGALFHTPIYRNLDLTAGVSLEHLDTGYTTDTGVGLRGGVRWKMFRDFEIDPELRWVNAYEDATSFRVSALYLVGPHFHVQGAVQLGDDERLELGLRYEFGPASRDYIQGSNAVTGSSVRPGDDSTTGTASEAADRAR